MDHGRLGGDVGLNEEDVGGEAGLCEAAAAIAAWAEAAAWWCLCDGCPPP